MIVKCKVENNINQIIKCIDLTCVYHVSLHYTLSSLSVTLSYTMSMLMVVPIEPVNLGDPEVNGGLSVGS